MADPVQDYLTYVRDVLGVRQVVSPKSHDPQRSSLAELARTRTGHWPEPSDYDLVILHRGEGLFEGPGAELWGKMRLAMNLGPARALEIETLPEREGIDGVLLEVLEIYPAPVSLILSNQPARGSRVLGLSKTFESYAPSVLVSSPDLKRSAWGDLQAVMRELGLAKS